MATHPELVMTPYRDAYGAANSRAFPYEYAYENGWFCFYRRVEGVRFFEARYRKGQLIEMTARLRERIAA